MAKVFDFVGTDGATFDAISEHSARFQVYLAREKDLLDNPNRILKLANPVVFKVYNGLLLLQHIMTSDVYPIPGIRDRTPGAMGKIGTRWGHPIVLFSKGKKQNKSVPASAFTNQALHCDFQPEVANANAGRRGKPVL